MQDDTPVTDVVNSDQFREQVSAHFGVALTQPFQVEQFSSGMSKVVWKISSPELPEPFMLKEIRFKDKIANDDSQDYNSQLSPKQAFYELETVKAIKQVRAVTDLFPKNIGQFATVHPINDSYTDELLEAGGVVNLARAKKLLSEERGISLFIAEEMVKGRRPTEEEAVRAKKMRTEGIKTHPRVWLTVDTGAADFFVKDDGSFVFFDVGEFKELTRDESKTLKELMSPAKGK